MKLWLTNLSIRFPRLILLLILIATVLFASQFPKVKFDNDPQNMLAADEPVRIFHNVVKERFALYDFVIAGVVNEQNPDGVFNVATLQRLHKLSQQLYSLQQSAEGLPQVVSGDRLSDPLLTLEMTPTSKVRQVFNLAFNADPNRLFDEQGRSAIIAPEIISPSFVDSLQQAELGALRLDYLMEKAPTTRAEALKIRDLALNNPLYRGTLAAEDGKAIAIYLPLRSKTFSYNVANLVKTLTTDWPKEDQVYVTGLPVAEDTFGVEMLVQMAESAPLAMLAIGLLMLLFFKRFSLIVAPLLVAVISVICTMGLLIGLGFDVHIMSSMIAIFLMPIAVADSVHILSEFYDSYPKYRDRSETLRQVIGHLFTPMLYTSLTTIVGFGSLAFAPIPPVQIFGLHVAFGVALAWLLSMTLVPAYILLCIPQKTLDAIDATAVANKQSGGSVLANSLSKLGLFSSRHWKIILLVSISALIVALVGITRISVNDNPVKWFAKDHQLRVADRILNQHFGGTYTAYLTLAVEPPQVSSKTLLRAVSQNLSLSQQNSSAAAVQFSKQLQRFSPSISVEQTLQQLRQLASDFDQQYNSAWPALADELAYLDSAGLTLTDLRRQLQKSGQFTPQRLDQLLQPLSSKLQGEKLLDAALQIADQEASFSYRQLVDTAEIKLLAPAFKQPALLNWIKQFQQQLSKVSVVGKSSSLVDALQKASFELQYRQDLGADINQQNFSVPNSIAAIGQVFTQLEGTKKKDSLFHLVTRDYQQANIWVQLTSGDNKDMETVIKMVDRYVIDNPPPLPVKFEWAGLTYLNTVWQERMVTGMLSSLIGSFIVVLLMMILLFRSLWFGLLAMVPLSFTIILIYGIIGWAGKDYDMPVAVLSSLTLGLSVDFAIHFLQRSRELTRKHGSWKTASVEMFKEPALAISRNAIIISVGFTPLLLAPLVPYNTVGFFLATIMAISWLSTLFILSALLTPLAGKLLENKVKRS
ncbi:MAG: MMPL family transporter [Desulfuromusa sp.]|nr:MMPL family transporter [Desulfuromusa sp.]